MIISAESPAVISPTETLSVHTPAMTDLNPGEGLFDLFDQKKKRGSRLKGNIAMFLPCNSTECFCVAVHRMYSLMMDVLSDQNHLSIGRGNKMAEFVRWSAQ